MITISPPRLVKNFDNSTVRSCMPYLFLLRLRLVLSNQGTNRRIRRCAHALFLFLFVGSHPIASRELEWQSRRWSQFKGNMQPSQSMQKARNVANINKHGKPPAPDAQCSIGPRHLISAHRESSYYQTSVPLVWHNITVQDSNISVHGGTLAFNFESDLATFSLHTHWPWAIGLLSCLVRHEIACPLRKRRMTSDLPAVQSSPFVRMCTIGTEIWREIFTCETLCARILTRLSTFGSVFLQDNASKKIVTCVNSLCMENFAEEYPPSEKHSDKRIKKRNSSYQSALQESDLETKICM